MQVVVKSELSSYDGKIMKLRQWIEDLQGNIRCEALFTIAFFDTRARKIITPPRNGSTPWAPIRIKRPRI
jgi:hypothetical protein